MIKYINIHTYSIYEFLKVHDMINWVAILHCNNATSLSINKNEF